MPTYLYEVLSSGELIEIDHPATDPLHTTHPESGQPIRRVYTVPNLGTRYGSGNTKNILSDNNLAKTGFTKYVRDPVTKRYNRTVGTQGPAQLRPKG